MEEAGVWSVSLRVLVERGETTISEDPEDRRAKNATLTKKGRKRLEHIAPLHVEDVQRLVFDPLTRQQTKALADAMTTVAEHLWRPARSQPRPPMARHRLQQRLGDAHLDRDVREPPDRRQAIR